MHDYRKLKVWEVSMNLVVTTYRITEGLNKMERYGLVSQLRRSAVSIPSNIAEGAGRGSHAQFAHFIGIAQGSSNELQTQLELCSRLNFITKEVNSKLQLELEYIQKMLRKLKLNIKARIK